MVHHLLRVARPGGGHVLAVDVLALDPEELAVEMMDISRKLDAENEVIEREKATLEAQLEGHVAALRALAQETWMVLDALADSLGLALSTETL